MPDVQETTVGLGDTFVSESGRAWQVTGFHSWRGVPEARVQPLGPDVGVRTGGVKTRYVEIARLADETHGWRRDG